MTEEIEVDISHGDRKAVIEGKTAVSFKRFVQLILQRKVTGLFKDWGDKPVIVDSELLTGLASAPQDSAEKTGQTVLVALGVGILAGVFFFSVLQLSLITMRYPFGAKELVIIIGSLASLMVITVLLMNMKRTNRSEKVVEQIEKIASFIGK